MEEKKWHIENPLSCPLVKTMSVLGGKWKPIILHMLSSRTMRFGELKKAIPPISQKMLTQQLRELEIDGVVERVIYPEVPPKVEYFLTASGVALMPAIGSLYQWGQMYQSAASKADADAAIGMVSPQ